MKIGVIGRGVVGNAVYEGLNHIGHTMKFFDIAYPDTSLDDVLDTECVFVCVPTDQTENGDCDTSIVEQVVNDLAEANYVGLIAIKSTVIPGTIDNLIDHHDDIRICSVPEFLRAKTALADFMYNHDLLIVGSYDNSDFELIKKIHGNIPKAASFVEPTEAEIIKYFNNVHHSVQIIFAGIAYEVCKKLGADYDAVYNAIIKRECFNPAYLMCNENLLGFGGHCLPKDTSAWCNLIKDLGLDYSMIQAVIDDNKKIKNG